MFRSRSLALNISTVVASLTLAASCNFATKKNYRKQKLPSESLFVTSSFLMERSSTPSDAIVRFKTLKPVMCELAYWRQNLGEQPSPSEVKLKACSNTSPISDFTETITGLSVNELYFVKLTAWDSGSDRSKASSVIIKEQATSTSSVDAYYARINIPLKSLDIHRINGSKAISDLVTAEVNRERKCIKSIPSKNPPPIFETKPGVLLEGLVSKGVIEGTAEKNPSSSDRLTLNKPSSNFGSNLDLSYRANGKSGSVALGNFANLTSAKAISDQTANFPEPQLTVAEREIISLNKDRSLRVEWSLNNAENASYVGLQLGYPGQISSVHCVFDAKIGFGEVPASLLKDIPSGKHDISLSVFSYVNKSSSDTSIFSWAAVFSDWRVAKFQVL